MADQPPRRRSSDPRAAAEALFKPKPAPLARPAVPAPPMPAGKEQVTIRIDRDVLQHFQEQGPKWQERINDALRKLVFPEATASLPVADLNASNDE
jgi:uncharacterized protein (DUF4415 family)